MIDLKSLQDKIHIEMEVEFMKFTSFFVGRIFFNSLIARSFTVLDIIRGRSITQRIMGRRASRYLSIQVDKNFHDEITRVVIGS